MIQNLQDYDICMECNEVIYNPLCHVCIAGGIRQWLGEHGSKEIRKKLNEEIEEFLKSSRKLAKGLNVMRCASCRKGNVVLCPYCFTEIIYKKLKKITKNRKLYAGFLSMFNFDFEHTGYTKDMERMGMI